MPFQIGAISARIALDASGYKRGIGDAENSNRSFGSSFQSFVTNPLTIGVGVVAAAGGGFALYASKVLAAAEETQRLAQRTGLSTDLVQALRAQLNLASGDGAKAAEIFNAFTIRLGQAAQGAGEAGPAFAQLGLDATKFSSTEEALRASIDALLGIEGAANRAAPAVKLFGEQGGLLLTNALEGAGSIDDLIGNMADLGQVIERDTVSKLASLNTTVGTVKLGIDGLLQSAVGAFLAEFADESGRADQKVRDIAAAINDELIPAARDLAELIQSVTGFTEGWTESNSDLAEGARVAADAVGTVLGLFKGAADATLQPFVFAGSRIAAGQTRSNLESVPSDVRAAQRRAANR
jgi:hypothetical protein